MKSSRAIICISLLMTFVASIFFIRCYNHDASGDELLYQYVWEVDDSTSMFDLNHRFERKIESFSDIVQTQVLHYKYVNGRSLVHAVEQAFTGHELAFSIINTVVFLLFVGLIVRYVTPTGRYRRSYWLWFGVVMTLLLFFPWQKTLWTSINMGLNYLWPATMSVVVFMLWDKIEEGVLARKWCWPMALLALVFGWTHEGFVVGLAGGMFIYYSVNIKRFRGKILALAIPMWISAAVMVFAPGNISRVFGHGGGGGGAILVKISNGVDNVLHLWVFMALMVCLMVLLLSGRRAEVKAFMKANVRLLYVMSVTFVFTLVLNTGTWTHTYVELLSLILIFRYICGREIHCTLVTRLLVVALTILFAWQQIMLARDAIRLYDFQHNILREYIESQDGLIEYEEPAASLTSKPFLRNWNTKDGTLPVFKAVYGRGEKELLILSSEEYKAVSEPESFFVEANKAPGNAPVYKLDGGRWYWVEPTAMDSLKALEAELYPVDWNHEGAYAVRLKFALFPGSYPSTERLEVDTIDTRYGRSYRIKPLPVRKIKAVNVAL